MLLQEGARREICIQKGLKKENDIRLLIKEYYGECIVTYNQDKKKTRLFIFSYFEKIRKTYKSILYIRYNAFISCINKGIDVFSLQKKHHIIHGLTFYGRTFYIGDISADKSVVRDYISELAGSISLKAEGSTVVTETENTKDADTVSFEVIKRMNIIAKNEQQRLDDIFKKNTDFKLKTITPESDESTHKSTSDSSVSSIDKSSNDTKLLFKKGWIHDKHTKFESKLVKNRNKHAKIPNSKNKRNIISTKKSAGVNPQSKHRDQSSYTNYRSLSDIRSLSASDDIFKDGLNKIREKTADVSLARLCEHFINEINRPMSKCDKLHEFKEITKFEENESIKLEPKKIVYINEIVPASTNIDTDDPFE